eukprot:6359609-Prymnesium_polylepis.1
MPHSPPSSLQPTLRPTAHIPQNTDVPRLKPTVELWRCGSGALTSPSAFTSGYVDVPSVP